MDLSVYDKEPIKCIDSEGGEIPCFSIADDYVENYEKISTDHVNHMEETEENPFMDETYWKACEASTAKLIKMYLKSDDKILDVGVGLGRLLEKFPEINRYGMDISTPYLSVTKRKGIDVCYSKIEDMPYRKNLFDIIVCTDVLEHVIDLNDACKKIISVLKKGGILIVRVPYKEDLEKYFKPDFPYEYVHLRSFDEYGLRLLFEKIHKLKTIDIVKAPYLLPFLHYKYILPVKGWRFALRKLASMGRLLGDDFHHRVLVKLFDPYEINIVFKK